MRRRRAPSAFEHTRNRFNGSKSRDMRFDLTNLRNCIGVGITGKVE
jgi:hypothetical protein